METRAPLPPPPDITITREDVRALPVLVFSDLTRPPEPAEGHTWHLERIDTIDAADRAGTPQVGRLAWVELPAGLPLAARRDRAGLDFHGARHLTRAESATAERAFLWQTALASDAALADMVTDADLAEMAPVSRAQVADVARRAAELRAELAALEGRAGRA